MTIFSAHSAIPRTLAHVDEPKIVIQKQGLIHLLYCTNCGSITEHTTEPRSDREICTCRNGCGHQVELFFAGLIDGQAEPG